MSDEREPGTLIHLFGEPPAVAGAPSVQRESYRCYPHSPRVDKTSRTVSCRRCQVALDPIDVLIQVADRYNDWVRLSEETELFRKQIEALKAEEKRVRARTASHARKDANLAVAEEAERWRERLRGIVAHTDDITRAVKGIERHIGLKRKERA